MLDEFVRQAKRLFSSRSNGANLVYSTTDKLHKYKLILFAVSIGIILGYSQFRPHFNCQNSDSNIDDKTLTTHCWINGTTTLNEADSSEQSQADDSSAPHVGIHFRLNDGKYEVITHNYMHSLWMLLLLMGLCSMLARRYYASIFERDSLVALLKLPDHENLDLVKRVQESPPYATLLQIRDQRRATTIASNDQSPVNSIHEPHQDAMRKLRASTQSREYETIVKMVDQNEDNLALDYYVNQLLCLLLANSATAYKISGLKLRNRLLKYQILSFLLTCLQFILPRLFIGSKYTLYGWYFSHAWWDYLTTQLSAGPTTTPATLTTDGDAGAPATSEPIRVGYDISAQLWPTSTQCQYEQFGFQGIERLTVQCTVSINEICGKLFAIIWWFVALNLILELFSLGSLLVSSLSYDLTRFFFSRRFWPKTSDEAHTIANFRYKHNLLINRLATSNLDSRRSSITLASDAVHDSLDMIRERKLLEATNDECRRNNNRSARQHLLSFLPCLAGHFDKSPCPVSSQSHQNNNKNHDTSLPSFDGTTNNRRLINESKPDENGFREKCNDVNMLFLLYLLYLRLRCSSKKVQLVIRATTRALQIYLESLRDSLSQSVTPTTHLQPPPQQHQEQQIQQAPLRDEQGDKNVIQMSECRSNKNIYSDVAEASFVKQADSTTLHVSRA